MLEATADLRLMLGCTGCIDYPMCGSPTASNPARSKSISIELRNNASGLMRLKSLPDAEAASFADGAHDARSGAGAYGAASQARSNQVWSTDLVIHGPGGIKMFETQKLSPAGPSLVRNHKILVLGIKWQRGRLRQPR
jgi:hypothetical protein